MLLDKLNRDVIFSIITKCDFKDIVNLSSTSKYFNEIINENSEFIYKNLVLRDFGYKYLPANMSWKELYQICSTADINGKWEIKSEMTNINNEEIQQKFKIEIILDENGQFEYSGKIDENSYDDREILFDVKGKVIKSENFRLESKINFFTKIWGENCNLGCSTFDGYISLYSYKIDKKIRLHGLFIYENNAYNISLNGISNGTKIS